MMARLSREQLIHAIEAYRRYDAEEASNDARDDDRDSDVCDTCSVESTVASSYSTNISLAQPMGVELKEKVCTYHDDVQVWCCEKVKGEVYGSFEVGG